jgi:hypothetical protein
VIAVEPNTVDASKCVALGTGIEEATAGLQNTFAIQLCDANGNPYYTGSTDQRMAELFRVQLVHQEDGAITVDGAVEDSNNGSMTVTYIPPRAGMYTASIQYDSQHIKRSPCPLRCVHGRTVGNACTAEGEATTIGVANAENRFTIQARDGRGNASAKGGENFSVQLEGPTLIMANVEMIPNAPGRYEVTYIPRVCGPYQLRGLLYGHDIRGSPFHLSVEPGKTEPSRALIYGTGVNSGTAAVAGAGGGAGGQDGLRGEDAITLKGGASGALAGS